jgi:hypothetical protein
LARRPRHPFLLREDLVTVRLAQLLRSGKPRHFEPWKTVRIEAFGHVANVEIVLEPRPTLVCGARLRRFLKCPNPICGNRRCNVLGADRVRGWTCPSCGRWRGIKKRRVHVPEVELDAVDVGLHGKAEVAPAPLRPQSKEKP